MANEEIEEIQDLSTEQIKDKATDLFESNKNLIYGGAGLIILLVGAFWFYNTQYMGPRGVKADKHLYKADQMLERDSFKLALNGRNVAGAAGNFKGYVGIIKDFGGTEAANIAHYNAGAACLRLGEHELALEYLKSYSGPEELQTQAYNMMGDAASSLKKMDEALGYYQKGANYTENVSLAIASLYKCGKLLEFKGDMEGAKKYYTQIIEKDKDIAAQLGVEKDLIRLAQ